MFRDPPNTNTPPEIEVEVLSVERPPSSKEIEVGLLAAIRVNLKQQLQAELRRYSVENRPYDPEEHFQAHVRAYRAAMRETFRLFSKRDGDPFIAAANTYDWCIKTIQPPEGGSCGFALPADYGQRLKMALEQERFAIETQARAERFEQMFEEWDPAPLADEGPKPASQDVGPNRRARVDAFISNVRAATGRQIARKDIWIVAGYNERSGFERFERGDDRATTSSVTAFNRVLAMNPEQFIRTLATKKKKAAQG